MQDSVQEALRQQHRLNVELQDQLRAQQRHNNEQDAKCARQQTAAESLYEKQTRGHPCEMGSSDVSLNQGDDQSPEELPECSRVCCCLSGSTLCKQQLLGLWQIVTEQP
ncbi:hypothetical protein KUCAC02_009369 [Chaenocephalus aceratus]|uniref:Uncharacterized protein n=1 Tax=Chaenocephalus aceratus TaxID=36190 RepID=A0ACB9WUA8_CHAAC|nr:hypothetical protein KUCAC02_009369 [Chaenocephalus aceratus]